MSISPLVHSPLVCLWCVCVCVCLVRSEKVKAVPEQLQRYRASKHFLHATELVTNTVSRLEGELATIEALRYNVIAGYDSVRQVSEASAYPHLLTLTLTLSPSPPHPHLLTLTSSPSPPHPHLLTLTSSPSPPHPHLLTLTSSPHPHLLTLTPSPSPPHPHPLTPHPHPHLLTLTLTLSPSPPHPHLLPSPPPSGICVRSSSSRRSGSTRR